ncbi:YHS domain-containing (seleno)protein [Pedobacter kyonggii]|uniref:YHS domain protein n=1 Tax=Pedobacter kyonggii TaxID=1926871 RepID=A0A4Q9HFI1_9SPHI|nr:YHS domain-containing (seleno)protein [Pedobacter kyonggii]TBO43593.1 YHS domain protein [Pedobacter kyonggii]
MYKYLLLIVFTALILNSARAQKKQLNLDDTGLALAGYDPVAYFTMQKAVEGKKEITLVHDGVTYRFVSNQHRSLFKANTAKYLPQYGGWCAYAMGASGTKVAVDPETFKLVSGKLYLFYNKFLNNTKKSWDKDESRLKTKADISWTRFTQN